MTGEDLFTRLLARLDGIAVSVQDAMVTQVPGYAGWPEARSRRLLDEVHVSLNLIVGLSRDDAPISELDLQHFAAAGQHRARSPMSVADLQAGFHVAHIAALQCALALAERGDHHGLVRINGWGPREMPRVLQAATTTFTAARRQIGDSRPARRLLAETLVRGTATEAEAAAAGTVLAPGYLVLLCRARQRGDRLGAAQQTATERCLRSVPGALWLGALATDGLLVLLPIGGDVASTRAAAAELTTAIAGIVEEDLHAAQAVSASPAAVPEAVAEARQVIALVATMPDVECRPYRVEELLVELAMVRQPALRQGLTDLLAPLANGTELQHTLEVLFSCGLDREKSAKALCIHRRTLTYRLARIREVTGINPASPHGIQLLRTALTAHRLTASEGTRKPADPASSLLSER